MNLHVLRNFDWKIILSNLSEKGMILLSNLLQITKRTPQIGACTSSLFSGVLIWNDCSNLPKNRGINSVTRFNLSFGAALIKELIAS